MNNVTFGLNDIVEMKKPHPCGTNRWEVVRLGADIKIKCCHCERMLMMPRPEILMAARPPEDLLLANVRMHRRDTKAVLRSLTLA